MLKTKKAKKWLEKLLKKLIITRSRLHIKIKRKKQIKRNLKKRIVKQ